MVAVMVVAVMVMVMVVVVVVVAMVVIEVGSLKRNMVVGQCLLLNGVVVLSLCVW